MDIQENLTCITQFADELLENIFCRPSLDFRDILNLSSTCQRFNIVAQSNEIWIQKFKLKWCTWKLPIEGDNIKNVFRDIFIMERVHVLKKLQSLATEAYDYDEVPYQLLSEFIDIPGCNEDMLAIFLEILYMYICEKDKSCDINRKYYAKKVYQYIYHKKLKKQWIELLDSNGDTAFQIETGAILIAKWCNPEIRISNDEISKQIDNIAHLVREKLPVECSCDHLSYKDLKLVLKAMNDVIYEDLGFKGNTNNYYDLKNSFIHELLTRKLGIPISLAVLYMAVGRRLHIDMQGVNFPGHFLIRIMSETSDELLYIDVFNNGLLLNESQCITHFVSNVDTHWPREVLFQLADKKKLFIRMVTNIINILKENTVMNSRNLPMLRTGYELMQLIDPDNEENLLLLSKIYLHQGINLEEVASNLRGMFSAHRNGPSAQLESFLVSTAESRRQAKIIIPKYRSHPENKDVLFRVGTLMKHKRYNYICVIYGWDPVCRMDDVWQAQMGVHRLENKDQQPFYHVLAHDGSSRYAAQESLMPSTTNSYITHPDVGRYFKYFNKDHYVFTDKLAESYPEDHIDE